MITQEHLQVLTKFAAEKISEVRRLKQLQDEFKEKLFDITNQPSDPADMLNDWYNGCTYISSLILHGNELNFSQISQASYIELENVWLKDVKLLDAYFLWLNNPESSKEKNYYLSCEKIRELHYIDCKHSPHKFEKVENYISEHFLKDGNINLDSSRTNSLINNKRKLLNEYNGHLNSEANSFRAKLYVEMFYENIIPAVVEKERKSICEILKAFQFSKSSKSNILITNAFEATIATIFLDNETVNELLHDRDNINFNIIPIDGWINDSRIYDISRGKLSYNEDAKLLIYNGTMTENEKVSLESILSSQKDKDAVNELYILSNLEPFEKMIL